MARELQTSPYDIRLKTSALLNMLPVSKPTEIIRFMDRIEDGETKDACVGTYDSHASRTLKDRVEIVREAMRVISENDIVVSELNSIEG